MDTLTLLLIAVALAMDVFAMSLGIGAGRRANTPRAAVRLAFHFGLFQSLMTLLGWLAGSGLVRLIASVDHWIAFGLLAFVGGRMIREGLNTKAETYRSDPTRGATLVILSIAGSIDAAAVGLSLSLLQVNILLASIVIGLASFGFPLLGLLLGDRLGRIFGKRMEIVGGLVLLGIGLRVLLTHLL